MTTMGKILVTVAFILGVGLVSFAQTGPTLTSEQKLRIERVNLIQRVVTLEKENADLKVQLTAVKVELERVQLKRDVEQANPGFTWNPETGAFSPKEPSSGELR